jgi:hypothetical protein
MQTDGVLESRGRDLKTRIRALETHQPNCMSSATKSFFIPVIHDMLRVVGHVATPELSPQGGGVQNCGTRGSARALPNREADLESWDTWKHRSCETRDGTESLLICLTALDPPPC